MNALETGITVQNEHLPFDASNAVCASTSYFRFLVWWKIFTFFFFGGDIISVHRFDASNHWIRICITYISYLISE